jgi:hypothetical protein
MKKALIFLTVLFLLLLATGPSKQSQIPESIKSITATCR